MKTRLDLKVAQTCMHNPAIAACAIMPCAIISACVYSPVLNQSNLAHNCIYAQISEDFESQLSEEFQ